MHHMRSLGIDPILQCLGELCANFHLPINYSPIFIFVLPAIQFMDLFFSMILAEKHGFEN